jgi:hypothetical protein
MDKILQLYKAELKSDWAIVEDKFKSLEREAHILRESVDIRGNIDRLDQVDNMGDIKELRAVISPVTTRVFAFFADFGGLVYSAEKDLADLELRMAALFPSRPASVVSRVAPPVVQPALTPDNDDALQEPEPPSTVRTFPV